MIECRIKQAAIKRGLKNPYQLAQAMARSEGREMEAKDEVLAGRLWRDGVQPTLASIDKAIGALVDCEVSEVLVRKTRKTRSAKAARK